MIIIAHLFKRAVLSVISVALAVFIGGTSLGAAQQVEVHLRSGQVVKGEVVSEDDAQITVKTVSVSKNGIMAMSLGYKRADIADIVRLPDPEQEYSRRNTEATSAAEHASLAQWCRDQAMAERALEHAQKALALDPAQASALTLMNDLGWVLVDKKWVKESEWLASQGKVRYQGKIMTSAEVDAFKAQDKQQNVLQDAQKAVDNKTAAIAAIDRQLADLDKRPTQIEAEISKASSAVTAAKGLAQKATSAKSAVDAAQKNLDQATAQNKTSNGNGGGMNNGNNGQNLAPLRQALEDAQKTYNAARREAGGADQEAARQTARIASLNDEKKKSAKQHDDLILKRATASKELEALTSTLATLTKAAIPPAAPANP